MVTSHLECSQLDKLHEYFLQQGKNIIIFYQQGIL